MTVVLITGAAGQLGRELAAQPWAPGIGLVAADRATLDVTDGAAVRTYLDELRPDVVVNAAAYTAVDRAEDEPDLAHRVNATAVAHLAEACSRHRSRLVHVSTDYVFEGTADGWYAESDPPGPTGVYGASKLAGEREALRVPTALVLRTSWVYSRWAGNFVTTMRRLAVERRELSVVDDQVGCPTSAADLARAIRRLVEDHPDACGLYHAASPGEATWHRFATAILADRIEAGSVEVAPIPTAGYPTRARRPANSRLDSSALARDHGVRLPHWRRSLPDVLQDLDSAWQGSAAGGRR